MCKDPPFADLTLRLRHCLTMTPPSCPPETPSAPAGQGRVNLSQRDSCGPPGRPSLSCRKKVGVGGVAGLAHAKGEVSHTTVGRGKCMPLCLLRTHPVLPKRKPFVWRTFFPPHQHTVLAANQRTPPPATGTGGNPTQDKEESPLRFVPSEPRKTVSQGLCKAGAADGHGSCPRKEPIFRRTEQSQHREERGLRGKGDGPDDI